MAHNFLIVWGMHRSGTSLLSSAMKIFGAVHTDNQLVIHSGNPTGYWEDRTLVDLNVAMMDFLHQTWDSLSCLDSEHVDSLVKQGFLEKALAFLEAHDAPLVALKDPRMAKLGLFWNHVFAQAKISPKSVVAYRNPLSVVFSLQRRRGIPQGDGIQERSYCYELWWIYTTQALHATAGYPRVCVDYDLFLRHPTDMLALMAQKLDLTINQQDLNTFLANILNTRHRHNTYKMQDILTDPECPPKVADLYKNLYAQASTLGAVSLPN